MPVIFQADLSFMPVQDVFQWVDLNKQSCLVTVSGPGEEDTVFYIASGKIVHAVSAAADCSPGEFLIKAGVPAASPAFEVLADGKASETLLTRRLLEKGGVDAVTLSEVFSSMVGAILADIFARDSGGVTVSTPLPAAAMDAPVSLETGRAVFDAVRALDEARRDTCRQDKACEEIIRRLNNAEFELPVMPEILTKLVTLMEDESSTFQNMAKLIMVDQVLTSSLLKVANSSYYGGKGQVDTLQLAIIRLGMKEIRNIVTAIQLKSLAVSSASKEQLREILDNAMKTAFVAGGLAQLCSLDPEEAFVGGLLMDLGKTVILSTMKDLRIDNRLLVSLIHDRHAEIGALIARKWNYPEATQNLIRYHHTRRLGGISDRMTDLLQMADHTVINGGPDGVDRELFMALGVSCAEVQGVYDRAVETFEQVKMC